MKHLLVPLALLVLAGCQRQQGSIAAGPGDEAQARTSAKALSDIAAAESAARAPMPRQITLPTEAVAARPAASPSRETEEAPDIAAGSVGEAGTNGI